MDGNQNLSPENAFQVPKIAETNVQKSVVENFGILPKLKRLNSYDDLTYHVTVLKLLGNNPNLGEVWPHGYIFKVTNPYDSQNPDLIDGQASFLLHVGSKGINAPAPVKNVIGTYWKHWTFHYQDAQNNEREISLIVRLFKFLPGQLLHYCPKSIDENLFFDIGQLAAKIHIGSKDFHHHVFDTHKHRWGLGSSPNAKEFIHVYPDENRRKIALSALNHFEDVVLANEDNLQKGQIHGDLNEHNLLVGPSPAHPSGYRLTGVIDPWDTHYSCPIYDVALAIAYMMLENHSVPIWEVGGHVLAGYTSLKAIPDSEIDILRVCIGARLAQSIVLGYYTYQQNPVPENEYVLVTQDKGWPLLEEVCGKTDDEVVECWKKVMGRYTA